MMCNCTLPRGTFRERTSNFNSSARPCKPVGTSAGSQHVFDNNNYIDFNKGWWSTSTQFQFNIATLYVISPAAVAAAAATPQRVQRTERRLWKRQVSVVPTVTAIALPSSELIFRENYSRILLGPLWCARDNKYSRERGERRQLRRYNVYSLKLDARRHIERLKWRKYTQIESRNFVKTQRTEEAWH